jgi:hypothetical protein
MASAVAVPFANTARFFPRRTQVTANPVRAEIRAGDPQAARASWAWRRSIHGTRLRRQPAARTLNQAV